MSQTILVVDDDPQIVRLVRAYLEQAGFRVITATDGDSALHAVRREHPDLLVLDLMMPGRDGRDVTRIVRGDPGIAHLPIIMLTARVEETDRIVGLEIGADDYVTKPFSPAELVARVRALLRRAAQLPGEPARLQVGGLEMDLRRHAVTIAGRPVDLTPTEFAILEHMLAQPGRAFTRTELIEASGEVALAGLERTVDSHVKNLRKKIEADPSRPEYVQTVYGIGYRLAGSA